MLRTDCQPDRFINGLPVYKPVSRFVIRLPDNMVRDNVVRDNVVRNNMVRDNMLRDNVVMLTL